MYFRRNGHLSRLQAIAVYTVRTEAKKKKSCSAIPYSFPLPTAAPVFITTNREGSLISVRILRTALWNTILSMRMTAISLPAGSCSTTIPILWREFFTNTHKPFFQYYEFFHDRFWQRHKYSPLAYKTALSKLENRISLKT